MPTPPLPSASLALLACPVCYAALSTDGPDRIACAGCGRIYPVRDGLPVLLAEASHPSDAAPLNAPESSAP